ncbi:hypothetical protein BGZ95_000679 [Linnemannia exigua]|uniref:Uncharacterized protein n=1 Tax=Linnemannia exigua TaxID=604196 RepID=A0AAD4H494_9FUNG|nr:hypothetical protein BGZ95_000679 [Linnemannia exigua]
MGILGFICITSTPDGSTIYGLDIAETIDESVGEFKNGNSFVIFKSTSNPPTPEALTWSVWSRVSLEDMKVDSSYNTYDFVCAVDSEGVFTVVYRTRNSKDTDPSAFRFDPNGTPVKDSTTISIAGNNGRGSWTKVKVETKFTWMQSGGFSHVLEYVNPSGPLQLMYSFVDQTGVYFFTYNDKTNTLAKFASKAILYTIRDAPTNLNPAPVDNIGELGEYIFQYRAIGGSSGGPQFLVYMTTIGNVVMTHALTLEGQGRMAITDLGNITVSDLSSRRGFNDSPSSGFIAATVVSIVAIVLLGFLAAKCYSRMKKETKTAHESSQAEAGAIEHSDMDTKETTVPDGSSNPPTTSVSADSPFTPATQSIPPQPPTTILPMAPIPSTSQQQTVQNQMQELGFSNHPRPSVASTAIGVPWQPTPFIPPTSVQRIRAPEQDSPAPSEQTLSSPPIPRISRPNPEFGAQPAQPTIQRPHT